MRHSFSIAGAAVLGLAGLTFAGSAQAVPVASLHQAAPLAITVADEGTYIKERSVRTRSPRAPKRELAKLPNMSPLQVVGIRAPARCRSFSVPSPRRNGRRACATTSAPSRLYRSCED